MITAKQLYNSYPHQQMRMYVEDQFGVWRQPAELGGLTKKFLRNFGAQVGGWDIVDVNVVPENLAAAFSWADTPEGMRFWEKINDYRPAPDLAKAPKGKLAVKPAAKKKPVGWW